jgi:4'-phosphopantetheinyl transferase
MLSKITILFTRNSAKLPKLKFKKYIDDLPSPIKKQILGYHRWQDQQASLFGKLLLKQGLKRSINIHGNPLVNIQYSKYSRPFINGILVDFNISHSGEYVVCAFGNGCRVGIDIEQMKTIDPSEFKPYFSANENQFIQLNESRFFYVWTRKEAFLKATGSGLTDNLGEIDVLLPNTKEWHYRELEIDRGYQCHIACDHELQGEIPCMFVPL